MRRYLFLVLVAPLLMSACGGDPVENAAPGTTASLAPATTAVIIMVFAVVQIIVHMVYFLHMSPRAEGGWTMTSLVFTVIVIGIMLAGSLWVMHHLNTNMMPMAHDTSQLP